MKIECGKENKETTKIAVVGSRKFPRLDLVTNFIENCFGTDDVLVSGGAEGVDKTAEEAFSDGCGGGGFPRFYENDPIIIKPDHSEGFNKGNYHKRNKKIVEEADIIVMFWDKKSKGTLSTLRALIKTIEEGEK